MVSPSFVPRLLYVLDRFNRSADIDFVSAHRKTMSVIRTISRFRLDAFRDYHLQHRLFQSGNFLRTMKYTYNAIKA